MLWVYPRLITETSLLRNLFGTEAKYAKGKILQTRLSRLVAVGTNEKIF
jgi:hypothetical protein